jgi:hypothetical protein
VEFADCPVALVDVDKAVRMEIAKVVLEGNGLKRMQLDRLLALQLDVVRAIEALDDYVNVEAEVKKILVG